MKLKEVKLFPKDIKNQFINTYKYINYKSLVGNYFFTITFSTLNDLYMPSKISVPA